MQLRIRELWAKLASHGQNIKIFEMCTICVSSRVFIVPFGNARNLENRCAHGYLKSVLYVLKISIKNMF